MVIMDNGPLLEIMEWYSDLFQTVKSESESVKEIIGKFKLSVLETLSKRGLFEMIRRKEEDEESTDKTFYDCMIAQNILWRIVTTVDDEFFHDYLEILKDNSGLVERLLDEKKRLLKINSLFEKHKDIRE